MYDRGGTRRMGGLYGVAALPETSDDGARTPIAAITDFTPARAAARTLEDDPDWREGRIPFRVRVAVSGHRDPACSDELLAAVGNQLESIRRQFPSSDVTPVRFTVLSSLAEGADRLVVEETRTRFGEDAVELHAVLPLPVDAYLEDFGEPESRTQFLELLHSAHEVTHIAPTRDRDAAYEHAGRWVVDHSDVLIALWDGHQASGRGGTAEIACYARDRGIPVLVVPTVRAAEPNRPTCGVAWSTERDLGRRLAPALQAFERIDDFNQGSIGDPHMRARRDATETRLSSAAAGSSIHWQYERVAGWALPRMVRADALAQKYQRRYYRAGEALYGLAACALAAVAAQAEAGINDLFALVEVTLMVVLVALYRAAHRVGVQGRWIGYRSLAEAFRSSLFIVMTGVQGRKDKPSGDYGAAEEPWFQRAFSEAWKERAGPRPEADAGAATRRPRREVSDLRRFLGDAWINDQIAYHRGAAARFHRGYTRLTTAIFVLFSLTIVIGIMHSFAIVPGDLAHRVLIFLAVALPAFGAALTGVRDQRQFRLHEDRSRRTETRLQQLKRNLDSQVSLRSVQTLAAQVQTVVEAENLDWSGVMEFQDLEMVI